MKLTFHDESHDMVTYGIVIDGEDGCDIYAVGSTRRQACEKKARRTSTQSLHSQRASK